MGKKLSDSVRIRQILPVQASAGTAVNGSWFLLSQCSGLLVVGSIGTANAGNNVALRFSADGTNPLGAAVGATVSPGNGRSFAIEVHEIPTGARFVRVEVVRAGAATTVDPWTLFETDVTDQPPVNTVANEFTLTTVMRPVL